MPARVRRFVIDPSGSSAKYVVKENLRLIETTAVGETTAISGEIYLSPDGLYDGATSSFTVDLRELKSDESRRDSYINRTTLDTSSFPFAEFVVESITGFPTDYVENTQVELTLSGSMTIHGVSQPMTFSVLARQAGNSLSAVADADFKMTDFGIEPPSVTIATARDEVHIQLVLLASSPRLSSAGADGCLRMTEGIVLGALAPGAGQVLQAISCAVVDVLNAGFLLVAHKS